MTDINTLVIESLHRQFLDDGDVFHAWEAYRYARRETRPLPDWVAAYFDDCAAALLAGTPASEALSLPRHERGGPGKLRQRETARRNREIADEIHIRMSIERKHLPANADLTATERAYVQRWFAPLRRGETKLDRVCELLAEGLHRPDNKLSTRPLSVNSLKKIYLASEVSKKPPA
jgi:hypothetical protein